VLADHGELLQAVIHTRQVIDDIILHWQSRSLVVEVGDQDPMPNSMWRRNMIDEVSIVGLLAGTPPPLLLHECR
jgi:hypothetical protein